MGRAPRGGKSRQPSSGGTGETGLIQTYFTPLAAGSQTAFGLRDDAALHRVPPGHELVLTADMLVEGIHVPRNVAPGDFAYKALAANLSDLIAKGADPAVYLLTLSLPKTPQTGWLADFAQGLADAQADFSCTLVGGDTVSAEGAVCVSITAAGHVPEGEMVHRFSASPGDRVFVTGDIGDAAAGLALVQGDIPKEHIEKAGGQDVLRSRYYRPRPSLATAMLLRAHASAAMDVSDGLVLDFTRMCEVSGCGGILNADKVPLSDPVTALIGQGAYTLEAAITGGDDYEALFTVAGEQADAMLEYAAGESLKVSCIGEINGDSDVQVLGKDGVPMQLSASGYDHF